MYTNYILSVYIVVTKQELLIKIFYENYKKYNYVTTTTWVLVLNFSDLLLSQQVKNNI